VNDTSNFFTAGGAALTSDREDWRTPADLFAALHREFAFTVDAAASERNALLPRFWTRESDAFLQDWRGERVFCNPPYGRDSGRWIAKFAAAAQGGGTNRSGASSGPHRHAGLPRPSLPEARSRAALPARPAPLRPSRYRRPDESRAVPEHGGNPS
jgi:hypothetical protein